MRALVTDPTTIGTLLGLAMALVGVLLLTGCAGSPAAADVGATEDPDAGLGARFEVEDVDECELGGPANGGTLRVLTDRETGVQYVAQDGSGWTPLVGSDGKPASVTSGQGE